VLLILEYADDMVLVSLNRGRLALLLQVTQSCCYPWLRTVVARRTFVLMTRGREGAVPVQQGQEVVIVRVWYTRMALFSK
jgi:hypothetical protein